MKRLWWKHHIIYYCAMNHGKEMLLLDYINYFDFGRWLEFDNNKRKIKLKIFSDTVNSRCGVVVYLLYIIIPGRWFY